MTFLQKYKGMFITLIALLTVGVVGTIAYQWWLKRQNTPPSVSDPFQDLHKQFPALDALSPEQRNNLSVWYDSLFKSQDWQDKMPYLSFADYIQIRPLPASRNAILRFLMKNTLNGKECHVVFDGFGIHTEGKGGFWKITDNNATSKEVALDDVPGFHAAVREFIDPDTISVVTEVLPEIAEAAETIPTESSEASI